jgi:hypothetical protein
MGKIEEPTGWLTILLLVGFHVARVGLAAGRSSMCTG